MIRFVNAKINIGLNIVSKRPDGYHDLETVFYPVGIECGLPHHPDPFDDILEITFDMNGDSGCRFQFMGWKINCPPRKNLVVRAASEFLSNYEARKGDLHLFGMFQVTLDKHLPDKAGLGGGSADAAFTIEMLNELTGNVFSRDELKEMAVRIGADCPFFLVNTPCFATGVGDVLSPINLNMKEYLILIIKPDVQVSTAEAFANVTPRKPDFDLRSLPYLPIEEWRGKVVNDFEPGVFGLYPELGKIKEDLYKSGALYASMSGSGSSIYGIYDDREAAEAERLRVESTYPGVWLFGM